MAIICVWIWQIGEMVIDKDEKKTPDLLEYATAVRVGDCTNEEVLRSLGVGNFDLCFVCIGSNFQSSLEITSLVKELGAKHVVSKANRISMQNSY